jgi:predicted enzyme related to lactoylglutathione lyase
MANTAKHPVNWFEIYTNDIERAKKFYATVLQTKFHDCEMPCGGKMSIFMPFDWNEVKEGECDKIPNAGGALAQMENVKPGPGGTVVYFQCEDCQVEQDRVEAAGGKVAAPKFSIGENGFCAVCIDTEGNCFGLHSMK